MFRRPIDRGQRLKAQGRFSVEDFRYHTAADVYRCPADAELRPMHGQKRQASGKMAIRYASRRSVCRTCPLRGRCLAGTRQRREIERWTDEDVIERHRARMRGAGEDMMRRRKALAEHPFGTLKWRFQPGAAHHRPRPVVGAARPARHSAQPAGSCPFAGLSSD